MEGLFQLVIIGVFIVASVVDAVSRGKKRGEQEGTEKGTGTKGRPSSARTPTGTVRGGTPGGRRKAPTGERSSAEPAPGASGEGRRTAAEEMIPQDFWAVLTGQAPAEPEPGGEAGSAAGTGSGTRAPTKAAPAAGDRKAKAAKPSTGHAEAGQPGTRRSARWMEGLEVEPPRAEPGTRAMPAPPAQAPHTARPTPAAVGAPGRRPADPMAEPWGDFEDISAAEIGDGRGATQGSVALGGLEGATRRPGVTDSPYVGLLATGRRKDLRSAVVLREVLGTPVGARGPGEGPGGWRWED
jgi:hypothetical protein